MLSLVLRGFMQRKLRVLLTGIAIALGVALMAGTYILTDTINKSFAGIFSVANRGHDVVITQTQPSDYFKTYQNFGNVLSFDGLNSQQNYDTVYASTGNGFRFSTSNASGFVPLSMAEFSL